MRGGRLAASIIASVMLASPPKHAFSQERILLDGGSMGELAEVERPTAEGLMKKLEALEKKVKDRRLTDDELREFIMIYRQFGVLGLGFSQKALDQRRAFSNAVRSFLQSVKPRLTKSQEQELVKAGILRAAKSKEVTIEGVKEPPFTTPPAFFPYRKEEQPAEVVLGDLTTRSLPHDIEKDLTGLLNDYFNGRPINTEVARRIATWLENQPSSVLQPAFGINASPSEVNERINNAIDALNKGDIEGFLDAIGRDSQFDKDIVTQLLYKKMTTPVFSFFISGKRELEFLRTQKIIGRLDFGAGLGVITMLTRGLKVEWPEKEQSLEGKVLSQKLTGGDFSYDLAAWAELGAGVRYKKHQYFGLDLLYFMDAKKNITCIPGLVYEVSSDILGVRYLPTVDIKVQAGLVSGLNKPGIEASKTSTRWKVDLTNVLGQPVGFFLDVEWLFGLQEGTLKGLMSPERSQAGIFGGIPIGDGFLLVAVSYLTEEGERYYFQGGAVNLTLLRGLLDLYLAAGKQEIKIPGIGGTSERAVLPRGSLGVTFRF